MTKDGIVCENVISMLRSVVCQRYYEWEGDVRSAAKEIY